MRSGTGDRSCRRRGGCGCRGGVRVGSGAVLHVGGPLPGAAGRDLGSVRGGAKPDFLPDRRLRRRRVCPAEPPRGARRRRARDPPGGVPSGRLASFLAPSVPRGPQSELAFRPPTRGPVLLLPVTSEELGIKLRLVFQPAAGQTAETFAVPARRPRALGGQGGTRAGGRKGSPSRLDSPRSPRGPRMGGCLTFHYPPSSEPAGAGSVCVRGDRGLCAPRGPPTSVCPRLDRKLLRVPQTRAGDYHALAAPGISRGIRTPPQLPSLRHFSRWTRSQGPVEIRYPMLAAQRGSQLTGDQVPSRHEAPEFAFHVFHQYSQSII